MTTSAATDLRDARELDAQDSILRSSPRSRRRRSRRHQHLRLVELNRATDKGAGDPRQALARPDRGLERPRPSSRYTARWRASPRRTWRRIGIGVIEMIGNRDEQHRHEGQDQGIAGTPNFAAATSAGSAAASEYAGAVVALTPITTFDANDMAFLFTRGVMSKPKTSPQPLARAVGTSAALPDWQAVTISASRRILIGAGTTVYFSPLRPARLSLTASL